MITGYKLMAVSAGYRAGGPSLIPIGSKFQSLFLQNLCSEAVGASNYVCLLMRGR